jgi:hypothetical protein
MSKDRKKIIENFGKVLIDLGKLTFASFVLGSIIKGDIDRLYILIFGAVIALVFIFSGVFLTSNKD